MEERWGGSMAKEELPARLERHSTRYLSYHNPEIDLSAVPGLKPITKYTFRAFCRNAAGG